MKKMRILTCVAAILAMLVLVVACPSDAGNDDPSDQPNPPTKVVLAAGSWGTAGNGTITGLTASKTYAVLTGGQILGVKADGTLGTMGDAATLSGTAITGLTNGTTYDVYELVTGTNGSTTQLDEDTLNTIVNISGLTNTQTHIIAANATQPAAQYVIVYVGQALEAATGAVIASQELEGATLDYSFGSTTDDNATFLTLVGGEEQITLDLSALTDASFTTTITVKTAD
jgi:hypothetical protein